MSLTKRTVLILGAGASMPYGFPSGDQLKQRIVSGLENFPRNPGTGPQLENLMHQSGIDAHHVEEFRDALAGAPHITIDRFLQGRPEFERVGKVAIAATLIPFEADSIVPMFHPWKDSPAAQYARAEGWYGYLAQQLDLNASNWGSGLLTIITYNYDRSLEHYLFTILKSTSGKTAQECSDIFIQIPMVHMYGQLGPYNPVGSGLSYGSALELPIVREAAANIRIMHESKDNAVIKQAQNAIATAEVICFLGFGYHAENLAPLGVTANTSGRSVLGTAYGLTDQEQRRLGIGRYLDSVQNWTVLQLLRHTDVLG